MSRHEATPYRRATLAAALIAAATFSTVPRASAQPTEMQPEALRQIGVLLTEKSTRTAAQRKLDSRLVYALKAGRAGGLLHTVPSLRASVAVEADDTVLVDLDARVDAPLLDAIARLGGRVVNTVPRFDAVRAYVPMAALETLAARADITGIRPADAHMTQMINVTEGDVAHAADVSRPTFGVDGTGVQVGAMSDSVDALATLQASGDLPPGVTVLPGQSGNPGTSEGTALLEIIHDMAPGADLFFATGQGGQAQMAQNILDLAAAGCDVIVDDVLYFSEPVFQDGIIAQAVDQVFDDGVLYFSSAGNSGNLDAGTAGVFEGDYVGTALPAPLVGNGISAHDFGGGVNANTVTADTPFFFTLQWADPQDAASNDFDFFLLDATLTNVLAASTNVQDGTQDPFEVLDSTASDDTGNRLVVVLFDGSGRFLHINSHRGQLAVATDGQIFGHPAAAGALAVAAVNVATAGGGPFVGGPANPVEPFSSDGPRRIFFDSDGTPVVSTRGGEGPPSEVRQKPDVTAADGVSTATPGFDPFFGTSASAPHSAAIAALYLELFPDRTIAETFDDILASGLDIDANGIDRNSGTGIMMTNNLLDSRDLFADGFESGDASAWTDQVP